MDEDQSATVIRLEAAQQALRHHFLGWQCRLRQLCVREGEGRPTTGMRPHLVRPGKEVSEDSPRIIVLLVPQYPEDSIAVFRHMVRKTHDPQERFKQALKVLQSVYFQYPEDFSDEMTALFAPTSELADQLLGLSEIDLLFNQYNQSYRLRCATRKLAENDPAYQATFWHNALFNASLPANPTVIAFQPDWTQVEADPAINLAGI